MEQGAITAQPVIETARFNLRPLRGADVGLLTHYAGDARVASMTTSIPHPLPPGAIEAMVVRAQAPERTEDVWAIDGSQSNLSELLGIVALNRIAPGRSEISYWVAPAFWNAGFASEAVNALLAANPQQLKTAYGSVFQSNPQSARVLIHAGFEYVGDAEAFSVAQNRMVPTWTYLKTLT